MKCRFDMILYRDYGAFLAAQRPFIENVFFGTSLMFQQTEVALAYSFGRGMGVRWVRVMRTE
jgi:hypothetical protein